VVVVSDALAERNGVGTYYEDLVQQLQGRLEHISLIAPGSQHRRHHEWFSVPLPGDATQRLVCPKGRILRQLIEEQQPHAVVIPTLGPYAYFASKIARRHKIGVCAAHHTNLEALASMYWNPLVAALCRRSLHSMTSWLIQRADVVATMNTESLTDAKRRGARCVQQMGTPVATSFVRKPRQPLRMNPPRVIFIGRLAAEKSVEQLLQAAERLPACQFRVAGDGPMREIVERAADRLPNLNYLGWLSRSEVLDAIDDADLLALPSRLETFGTVALEALARHRLVLVAEECGIVDWPELAKGLFTIQRNEHLATALRRIVEEPLWRQEWLATRSWEAVERFNEETLGGWINLLAVASGVAYSAGGSHPE
jgi:glycosyltransferase involved in cell wall biosynthesis